METVAFIQVLEVGISTYLQKVLDLFQGEVGTVFQNLNERDLVLTVAFVDGTLVFSENVHEGVLAVQSCVQDWK